MLVTLNEVLIKAKREKYAVGLFNTVNTDMLDAVIQAAEEQKSPVIIGTAEVLLPYGELELIAPSLVAKAKAASVPVVLHFDHGLTFENTLKAMKLGFSSVMYDCSNYSEEENIEKTREMVKIAKSFGVSVEAEIGHIGGTEGQSQEVDATVHLNDIAQNDIYTTVKQAKDFYEKTQVDALAVAIGTAHGAYKFAPKLNFTRLEAISAAVGSLPLVLHGGSGLTDSDFRMVIERGIAKINIFTDLTLKAKSAAVRGIESGASYLDMITLQKESIREETIKKMKLFGSNNKC